MMMRSMVRWTEKFRSRCEKSGLLTARLRASASRQDSISVRNAVSTSAVPFFALLDSAYLSKEPFKTASREKTETISSQFRVNSAQLPTDIIWAVDALSVLLGLTLQSYTANSLKSV